MTHILALVQWAGGLTALAVALPMIKVPVKAWRGTASHVDLAMLPAWLLVSMNALYILRWAIFDEVIAMMAEHEIMLWMGLRVLSIILCLFALATYFKAREQ